MRNVVTIVTLIALAGAALTLAMVRPTPLPRSIEVAPTLTRKLVCAPMADSGVLFVDGATIIAGQGADSSAAAGPTQVEDLSSFTVLRGGASLLGGILTTGAVTGSWTPCTAPTSQGTIVVPSAADTDLLVVNPDSSEAVVDLSLLGSDGEIVALGARGIAVGPHASRTIALSVLVQQEGPVGVSFRASRGRAAVVARTTAPVVMAAATASSPGREHWLAGVPAGATTATLLVSNPGNERAAIDVTAHGATTAYQPEDATGMTVAPHTTVALDLAPSLAGEPTGLHVSADVDVAVGLSTGTVSDLAFSAPVSPSARLGAYAPAGGVLQLSNPAATDVEASLTLQVVDGEAVSTSHTVPAGSTLALPLESPAPRGQVIDVTADTALAAAVVESASGVSIVPLTSTDSPPAEPIDAEIVPTLR